MPDSISFNLNGRSVSIEVDGERPLLWVLRSDLGLTGTKSGCGEGHCGACTVLVDGEPVRSCQTPVREAAGKQVMTIEGLSSNGKLHPLQEAFIKHYALQCGFCTPGMLMSAYSLIQHNPNPSREQIVEAMEDNFCRCGTYSRIIEAVRDTAQQLRGEARDERR
ncbi:MAG TPA: (2Fe-2S)-binding protein [Acidobacteriota bacterium]|nr:(2Fe-2S)-binding protein [Acidobacteriota bacterium]